MAEMETAVEGVETEVETNNLSFSGTSRTSKSCRKELKKILNRLADNCEQITIIIRSGSDCCELTGCICDVDNCFVVLMDADNPCERTYILLDCICAVENCIEDAC